MATEYHNLSADIIWQTTRNNNAYLVKRKQAGGVTFSRDPYNLLNKHSHKHAGYAKHSAIAINPNGKGQVIVGTKNANKHNKPGKSDHVQSFGQGKSARSISKSVVSGTAKKGYRTDLRGDAVARVGAIKKAQRPVKDGDVKPRGGRKSKATAVEA